MVIRMIRITIRIAMFHVKQWENEWVWVILPGRLILLAAIEP